MLCRVWCVSYEVIRRQRGYSDIETSEVIQQQQTYMSRGFGRDMNQTGMMGLLAFTNHSRSDSGRLNRPRIQRQRRSDYRREEEGIRAAGIEPAPCFE